MDRPGSREAAGQPVEYHPGTRTYSVPFDPSTADSVAGVVATGVAAIEDVDQTDLPAVHDVVDPEAVDRLIASADGDPVRSNVVVEFPFSGYLVTVRLDEVRFRSTS